MSSLILSGAHGVTDSLQPVLNVRLPIAGLTWSSRDPHTPTTADDMVVLEVAAFPSPRGLS